MTGANPLLQSGSSTASAQVNYRQPINGAYDVRIWGNNLGRARLYAANGFKSLRTLGSGGTGEQNFILSAHVAGALGTGDVSIENTNSLEIHAANAMADQGTLILNGVKSDLATAKLVLHADDTVRSLYINGEQQPAGMYDSESGLIDPNGNPLIGGAGKLTVLQGPGGSNTMNVIQLTPSAGANDVRQRDPLLMVFNNPVAVKTGNITLRNLTDSMDIVYAVDGPAVTATNYTLTVDTGIDILWGKSYAVRVDSGAIENANANGVFYAGIANDTTWTFSTLASDPLLNALGELKAHIESGMMLLTTNQIAQHKLTIDAEKARFAESAATITAVRDLILTYEAVHRLFVDDSGFADRRIQPVDLRWTMYHVMQYAMDTIYKTEVIAAHEGLLTNFYYQAAKVFPGWVAPPAAPYVTNTVTISAVFTNTFGRQTQNWTEPARKPTGTYLAPGSFATVTVPANLVNKGYRLRVGCHSWDLTTRRTMVRRFDRATIVYPITQTEMRVGSPYGGGIYIEVPLGMDEGLAEIKITGSVRAPYFSAKSFHTTTPEEWENTERLCPAPWADFQSDKFMMQVPRTWIYNLPGTNAVKLMAEWDAVMDAQNELMGYPFVRGKETMYLQPDIVLRSSVHAPGYPAVNWQEAWPMSDTVGGYKNNYFVRGPNVSAAAVNIEIHEQGHAYFFDKFGGESESTVNLPHVAVMQNKFGRSWDEAFRSSLGYTSSYRTIDNTAVAWMCVFNFSPREAPMATAEKAYQLKGHAKFVELARLYGWDKLGAFWRSFLEDIDAGIPYATDNDSLQLRLAKNIGWDTRPLFHFWGLPPVDSNALAAAFAANGLPPSPEIYDLLVHYQSLVPANNAAFRAFAQNWWGRTPSITGNWEEREHARQWDQTALFGEGDQQRADITINEEYIEACAQQVRDRVQEIIDLYFPNGRPTATTPPSMSVSRSASTIANGGVDGVRETTAGVATSVSYLIANGLNGLDLALANVTVSALSNCTATVTAEPASNVPGGGGTSLGLSVTPINGGVWGFTVAVANNDPGKNPYS